MNRRIKQFYKNTEFMCCLENILTDPESFRYTRHSGCFVQDPDFIYYYSFNDYNLVVKSPIDFEIEGKNHQYRHGGQVL